MAWRNASDGQSRSMAANPAPGPLVQRALAQPKPAGQGRSATTPPSRRLDAWSAEVFDVIEWRRFEAVVEVLFAQAGFDTRSQPCGADGGVDIWLHSHSQHGAAVSLVQCKQWTSWKVGVKPIRELRGVMAAHSIARGQFVSTSGYTADAKAFAQENGIMLHSTSSLLDLIASRTASQQRALLDVAFEGDYWRPTCASCGVKMIERTARASGSHFWGCTSFPKCRGKMQMKPEAAE